MVFQKVEKTSAYTSRMQTPRRRRREGKTDYYARKKLVTQHKAKYNSPKYRLVVRITNKDVVAQIVTSEIVGDKVMACAYAHELPRYGITNGLTNWASCYAVGLLIARRVLKQLKLDETYTGDEEHSGEFELTEAVEDAPRPFKVFLDVGLARTTTGARVFAVMKGASDGGLYVPHSPKRLPGWDIESEELDAETCQKYLVGGHVQEFQEELLDDDEERYRLLFSQYEKNEVEDVQNMFEQAHEKIRADPEMKKTEKKSKEEYAKVNSKNKQQRLTKAQRDQRVQEKINAYVAGN